MAAPAALSSTIRFGAFDLDAATGELRKAGVPIKLRHQAVEVLIMLTKRAGQVVTREEIRERLWSDDTFVDFERSINFCINQIRAALGDDAEKPRYLETLPRRGYRFIAAVDCGSFATAGADRIDRCQWVSGGTRRSQRDYFRESALCTR